MPIAGLVLTLSNEEGLRTHALETLAQEPRLTIGALQRENKLPVVTDTHSLEEQQALWHAIAVTPGVLLVDLTFEDFSDVGEFASDQLPSKWKNQADMENSNGSA